MYLKERGWGSMDWNDLAQDRDQNTVINLGIPQNLGKFLSEIFAWSKVVRMCMG
jgi:hypothetical protein